MAKNTARLFLQTDPDWSETPIWSLDLVSAAIGSHEAKKRLRAGTTIRDQGCQLCCLAMVLHQLHREAVKPWDPASLLEEAREDYLSDDGVSLAPLYADLCADVSDGRVQLLAKEVFSAGGRQPKLSEVGLVRAYRDGSLPEDKRDALMVMLRIGTHDETEAAHYLLLDPDDSGSADSDDALVLDPDMPESTPRGSWTFANAWSRFLDPRTDEGVRARAVKAEHVEFGQVAAVYLFGRRAQQDYNALLGALL